MTGQRAVIELKRISYKLDIVFISIFLTFSIFGGFYLYHLEYEGGLANDIGRPLLLGFIYLAVGVLLLFFWLIRGLIRVCLPPWAMKHILVKIISTAMPFITFYGSLRLIIPMAPVFLKGFEKRVINEVDINAIQKWLATEGQRYEGQFYSFEFPSDFPLCLTELKPAYILFNDSESDGTLYIEIGWGGMSKWGLRIGPPSMNTPEEGLLKIREGYWENRRPVAPGAYVFTGG